ncbi:MAG: hypothetical protein ACYSWW_01115 [Planctomycetota bacterium]|jgi:hypothetical protein
MAKPVKIKKRGVPATPRVGDSAAPEQEIKPLGRTAFSGWPMIIGWLAMLVFTVHACTHMVAAGDTWVAMACGRHFVNHGVDTVEPFSANSHKAGPTEAEIGTWPDWAQWIADKAGIERVKYWHPTGWVNQNWLTHVIFYSLVPKSSYADGVSFSSNALVYWKFAIYIITVICVYYTGRLLGANPALCAIFSCFAMFTGRSFLDVRPAGFSNMLVAVFLLILVLATYRNILYIWLIVPVTVFWCNVHGGYIYVFIVLTAFVGLNLPTGIHKKTALISSLVAYTLVLICFAKIIRMSGGLIFLMVFAYAVFAGVLHYFRRTLISLDARGICHTVAAGLVTFAATIVFNPFHLTNLTHTFVISISEHAERWRDIHEWKAAFDWTNPVGTAKPFLVMFIIALICLFVWVVVLMSVPRPAGRRRKRKARSSDEYRWPKIDLALMIIAALTIYMAIRSRRFIPIAAIAACPVIAMLIDQIIRAISVMLNFQKKNRLVVSPMPYDLQLSFTIVGAVAVLFFGTWWGLKFKRIYLDAWPADAKLSSVFLRMTASDAKPFYALKFIKDNKLEGKMLNYWTEGGFIAWGQEPCETGSTPLQLFMDGRAQAAYDRKAFDDWSYIMSGGPPGSIGHEIFRAAQMEASYKGRSLEQVLTSEDRTKIGQSMNQELENRNVWVVLMPAAVFGGSRGNPSYHAIRAIERHPNWRLIFVNNRQKLYVDIRTPRGRELFEGIFTGKTIYPDDYHTNLIRAHNWLLYRRGTANERREGLDFALKAFELNPSPTPLLEILAFASSVELKPEVEKFCENYVREFAESMGSWANEDGYRLKTQAAHIACIHLKGVAQGQRNTKLVNVYAAREKQYLYELRRIAQSKRW